MDCPLIILVVFAGSNPGVIEKKNDAHEKSIFICQKKKKNSNVTFFVVFVVLIDRLSAYKPGFRCWLNPGVIGEKKRSSKKK